MPDLDLNDFGAAATVERPLLKRQVVKQSPHNGKIAGFICKEVKRPMTVYASRRWRSHYYRNGDGYAISDSILDSLEEHHTSRIIIYDGDEEEGEAFTAWEFPIRQYTLDGKDLPESQLEDEDDPQTYVPVDECLHRWQFGRGERLFVSSFEHAMDRINWRGYDSDLRDRLEAEA